MGHIFLLVVVFELLNMTMINQRSFFLTTIRNLFKIALNYFGHYKYTTITPSMWVGHEDVGYANCLIKVEFT
jgi:hypothetical protein